VNTQKVANIIIIVFAIVIFLIVGQNIIIPLILSIFSWFLIKEIREVLDKSSWIRTTIPRWVKTIFAVVTLLIVISIFSNLLFSNAQNLANSLQKYNTSLINLTESISQSTGVDITKNISSFAGGLEFKNILSELVNSITGLLSNSILILLYLIFILLEESTFLPKMRSIYPEKATFENINDVLLKIDKSIGKYISIKTFLSFLTGSLSYIILLIIGIESALFFAFLIFILNFIPSIGSLIGTLFPTLMALLQFGEETLMPFILVLVLVGAVQVLIGNFLEPKLMGNSLNISSLVVILSLTVWGAIWGIAGMVLSVPITVIMIIIFSNFNSTKQIAILLSEKGKLDPAD
jgi:predicted PurR-regulated permease PerM